MGDVPGASKPSSPSRRQTGSSVDEPGHIARLLDLLWRWRRGELETDVVAVVSNHPDHARDVAGFDVPYHHVQVPAGGKTEAEAELLELLAGRVDLVVLARYMQILSGGFLQRL